MKYCVPYSKNFKYLTEVDEIIFQYGENHNEELFYNLVSKEDKFKNKRIIIQTVGNYFKEKNSIKFFIAQANLLDFYFQIWYDEFE